MQRLLIRQIRQLSAQRWRQYALKTLIRAVTIGLGAACVGAMLSITGIIVVPMTLLGWFIVGCALAGSVSALRFRLPPRVAARRLDRRFGLREQLTTATELDEAPIGVAHYLQQQAEETLRRVEAYVRRNRRSFWPDALLLSGLLIALAGLLVMAERPMPPVGEAEALPFLNPPDPVAQEQPAETPAMAERSPVATPDPSVLTALADALRDQSISRPAAEALDRGDVAGAANELRELADQMGEVSSTTRRQLAEQLREAARAIDQARPDLADQLRATADALQFGDATAGAVGIEALADALERQPGAPVASGSSSGGAGNGTASQRREQSFTPQGIEGTPLPLETSGTGQVAAEATAAGSEASNQSGNGVIRARGATTGGIVQTADDPLQIPMDVRDVVRNYFSP